MHSCASLEIVTHTCGDIAHSVVVRHDLQILHIRLSRFSLMFAVTSNFFFTTTMLCTADSYVGGLLVPEPIDLLRLLF